MFQAKVKDDFGNPSLSVCENGWQWTSIILRDAENQIPIIIDVLQEYLDSLQNTTGEHYVDKRKG